MKNRPQKAWAGLANARLLLRRYAQSSSVKLRMYGQNISKP